MIVYEARKNDFVISTDKTKLDIPAIHNYLSNESYWAKNIPVTTVQRSVENSFCFGLYVQADQNSAVKKQIGFTRVITDFATFAYLADVFIVQEYRGRGLSKWLIEQILNCEALQGLRSWMLATKDAHGLYEQFGFVPLANPLRFMRLSDFEKY